MLIQMSRPQPDNSQTFTKEIHDPAGFEPAIPASERQQTHISDGAVIGIRNNTKSLYFLLPQFSSFKLTMHPGISLGRNIAGTKSKELLICTTIVLTMHKIIMRLVYIHGELLHVSTNHVTIFRDVKYRG